MRSSVADSRGEVSTEEILPGCGDDNGDVHRKETLGVDTAFPEHLCQAESGCVMSCNPHRRSNRSVFDVQSSCKRSPTKELSDGA